MAANDYLGTHYTVPISTTTKEFTLYLAVKRLTTSDAGLLFSHGGDNGVFSLEWNVDTLTAIVEESLLRTSVTVPYTTTEWSILSVVCNKANSPSSKFRIRLNGQDLAQTLGDSDDVVSDFTPSEARLHLSENGQSIELRAWLMFELAHSTQKIGEWETRLRRRYL